MRTDCGDGDDDVVEVRCPNAPTVLHFKVINRNTIEVKCKNKRCTGGGETVVLHRYSFPDLKLIQTLRFQDPEAARARKTRKENP